MIAVLEEELAGDESPVEIVLQRLNDHGSADELLLEGDLGDARSLISTLESEGNCVEVAIVPPQGEGEGEEEAPEEAEGESPGAGEEVAEPVESPDPVFP